MIKLPDDKCPICGLTAHVADAMKYFALWVNCDNCGRFFIETSLVRYLSIKTKACIYHYLIMNLHENEEKKLFPRFHNENWEDGVIEDTVLISEKALLKTYPKRMAEKINLTIMNIAKRLKYQGETFTTYLSEKDEIYYPVFFIDDSFGKDSLRKQFNEAVENLKKIGYLKHVRVLGDNMNTYTLTHEGWERAEELLLGINIENNKDSMQCFIAMWFDDSMKEAELIIEKAISDCGFKPMIINKKEHNNFIVQEILQEIRDSKFVIADLTGSRGGVYFEAGYAEGLGKPVILTCKDESFADRHFDLAQKNTIKWSTVNNLYEALIKRIKETIK